MANFEYFSIYKMFMINDFAIFFLTNSLNDNQPVNHVEGAVSEKLQNLLIIGN